MSNELIITDYNNKKIQATFVDKKMIEVSILNDNTDALGNIYVARVDNIVKNIDAAFVNITKDLSCYLDLAKVSKNIVFAKRQSMKQVSMGDEIIVQLIKDSVRQKAPVVTTDFSLAGKYVSLINGSKGIFVSKKISDKAVRNKLTTELTAALNEFDTESLPFGIIARTNSETADINCVKAEMFKLIAEYNEICASASHSVRYTLLKKEVPEYLLTLRDTKNIKYDKILTTIDSVYEEITEFNKLNPILNSDNKPCEIEFHKDRENLNIIYKTGRFLELASRRIVNLKSGACIYIDHTEALTAIDVNSGKAIAGKRESSETFYKINREAAEEIAYQLRLRNISGMIIIDFINMDSDELKQNLVNYLKELIKTDPVQTEYVDITKLGLVEITRRKFHKSLAEQLQ